MTLCISDSRMPLLFFAYGIRKYRNVLKSIVNSLTTEERMTEGTYTLYKRENGYWYYWTYDKFGRRFQKSTGKKTKSAANAVAAERLKNGTLLTFKDAIPYTTFSEYVRDFYIWGKCRYIQGRLARGFTYSKKAAKTNRYYLEHYIVPYFGDKAIEEITLSELNSWLIFLPEEVEISNKTANNVLSIVRQIFGVAVEDGLIKDNIALKVKSLCKSANSKRRVAFTREQIQLILTGWDNNVAATACHLAAVTGMRSGEIRALWQEQLHDNYIEVNASYNNKDDGRKCTKSGYSRFVPITDEIRQMIENVNSGGQYVFSFDGEHPVSNGYFDWKLQQRMEALGIKAKPGTVLSFHSFRHFFNTRLIAAGVQGEKIRAVIGHEDESMTEHYAHLEPEDLKQILEVQRGAIA